MVIAPIAVWPGTVDRREIGRPASRDIAGEAAHQGDMLFAVQVVVQRRHHLGDDPGVQPIAFFGLVEPFLSSNRLCRHALGEHDDGGTLTADVSDVRARRAGRKPLTVDPTCVEREQRHPAGQRELKSLTLDASLSAPSSYLI